MEFDVVVTKKRLLKPNLVLRGKILKEYTLEWEDFMGFEYEEKYSIIMLENGKKIKYKHEGIFNRYNYVKMNRV